MAFAKPCTWTHVVPTSGQTLNVPIVDAGTTSNLCLDHPASILLLTLAFPITGVQDGQLVKIAAKSAVVGLTMNVENGGVIQGLLTTLIGSGNGIYQFEKATSTWYKFDN